MKAKTKIISLVLSMCLVGALFAIGVFALKTANLKIGGDVSFTATGVEASIKNANITGVKEGVSNADFVMGEDDELLIDTSMTQNDIDTDFATWKTLNLTFNENADDIVISFDIANMSLDPSNFIELDYTASFT